MFAAVRFVFTSSHGQFIFSKIVEIRSVMQEFRPVQGSELELVTKSHEFASWSRVRILVTSSQQVADKKENHRNHKKEIRLQICVQHSRCVSNTESFLKKTKKRKEKCFSILVRFLRF